MDARRVKFTATIVKIGINPVVDLPDDVLESLFIQAGRSKGPVPVRGLINGAEYLQTLVRYQGKWRLYINGEMLKASGLNVGNTAPLEIEFDPRPRTVPVPKRLEEALAENKVASEAFNGLTPSRQKEISLYLGSLKSNDALNRNIEKVIKTLTGGKMSTPPVFMARKKRSA